MAVSQAQIVDLLYKQAFGVTKTDTSTNKSPSNESIPSPLLMRGDTIWLNSSSIPGTAADTAGLVQAYTGSSAIQTTADTTTVPVGGVYPTWKTNLTDWIPAEFGATYNVSVYVDNANAANPVATGTQIFAAGSGGNGQFYFNYTSGVLNFIGETIPSALTASKVLYIVGYRYIGPKGINNFSPSNVNLGNININNNTISTIDLNGNLILEPNGTGYVVVPNSLDVQTDIILGGNFIVNGESTFGNLDVDAISATGNISGNGLSGNTLNISGDANVGNLISLGAISATGNLSGGNISTPGDINANGNIYGNNLSITNLANVGALEVTGNSLFNNLGVNGFVYTNLIPSIDVTYDLGNATHRWKDLYLSGNSIILGNTTISSTNDDTFTTANIEATAQLTANVGLFNGNVLMEQDLTIVGNLSVSGNTTYINVSELNVTDPIINLGGAANGGNSSAYDGLDRGLFLHNYDLSPSGPVNQFIGWQSGIKQFSFASEATVSSGVVTIGTYGNVQGNTFIGNLEGTVLTSAQNNITSLGNLLNLDVAGNTNIYTTANIKTLVASNLSYPTIDGTNGQYISTNGNGVLSLTTVEVHKINNGSSNVFVFENGNVATTINGNANVLVISTTGANLLGSLTVTANLTANTLTSNNGVTLGSTDIQWKTLTTTSTTADQAIVRLNPLTCRGVEFFVKGVEVAGAKYCVATLQAVHDDSDVDFSSYGTVYKGSSPGAIKVIWNSGNIELVVTPTSSNSTVWTTQYRTI